MIKDLRVSFIGDSFVQGLGDPEYRGWVGRVLQRLSLGEAGAFNLGIRRNSSRDVLARWRTEVGARLLDGADNRLVLSVGSNDAMPDENGAPRVDRADFLRNVTAVLTGAQELGIRVLVVGPPPVMVGGPEHLARLLTVVPELAALCAAHGVPFVDVTRALVEDPVWVAEATAGDGAHPGAGGYGRLADLVLAGGFGAWLTGEPEEERNAEAVRRYLRVFETRAVDELAELVAEDVLVHGAGFHGRGRHLPEGAILTPGLSNCRVQVDDLVAAGDRVTVAYTQDRSGRDATMTGVKSYRLAQSRIVEFWGETDLYGLLRRLDLAPAQLPEF
ncbi:hypothetical protein C7C46_28005 [Streptomyces tateyamensis]|uniref:SGNH hydrolase-type esterase domain-containing protein n=1 Tax=Streptomyces tateyamensis TaxID=565073 RepID=A0A2V4MV10_9ACTN|nr:GDSL-type esterase/lipase family protein [Streptomyces tateyamensis]PYC69529.1 hypothetical protein C7C46_28005 [Streptomyces tateyamensis]